MGSSREMGKAFSLESVDPSYRHLYQNTRFKRLLLVCGKQHNRIALARQKKRDQPYFTLLSPAQLPRRVLWRGIPGAASRAMPAMADPHILLCTLSIIKYTVVPGTPRPVYYDFLRLQKGKGAPGAGVVSVAIRPDKNKTFSSAFNMDREAPKKLRAMSPMVEKLLKSLPQGR